MKVHRFLVDAALLKIGSQEVHDPDILHQWKDVLRLEEGDDVVLFDGKGNEARATISSTQRGFVVVEVAAVESAARSGRDVVLYAALLKRENAELVLQKATEIGVTRIVPLITARTVKLGFKMDRAQKIVREAAEQCGRADVPVVDEPMRFAGALAGAQGHQAFLHTSGASLPLRKLEAVDGLWVGPEGGWTDEEAAAARSAGCDLASLGPLTLRAETAAIVAAYLAVHS